MVSSLSLSPQTPQTLFPSRCDAMQLHIYPRFKKEEEFIRLSNGPRRISHFRALKCLRLVLLTCLGLMAVFMVVFMVLQALHFNTKLTPPSPVRKEVGGPRSNAKGIIAEICKTLEENQTDDNVDAHREQRSNTSRSLKEFLQDIRSAEADPKTFALMLKAQFNILESKKRSAKIREYLYRHAASTAIPRHLHCLVLSLAGEYSASSAARVSLPAAPLIPTLTDNTFLHFVLASDNVLAASVVAASLARNAREPGRIVLHVVTEKKTYTAMHAWFALHPLDPMVVEVKALHQFDWFTKGTVPVMETMEKDWMARSQVGGGSSETIVSGTTDTPRDVEYKLQALTPKYNSIMNHIRIHLPELFPSLKKVVFLDDDVVIQQDLSPLWDIDLHGNVNGAVKTCEGDDKFVMSKRLKSYLNFSHPLIASNFDPEECAWAYGMNIFDLETWRKTNISTNYHRWVDQNVKSDLSLWHLGTLPPGLIAFRGHVEIIDARWHMLGLGYQARTSLPEARKAAVVHFNGKAKPWLEIAYPKLRKLWSNYVDYSDRFVRACNVR